MPLHYGARGPNGCSGRHIRDETLKSRRTATEIPDVISEAPSSLPIDAPAAHSGPDRGARSLHTLRSKAPVSDTELATQCVLDTAARASTATFIYPGVWLAITLATGASSQWPWLVWGNAAGLFALSLMRFLFNRDLAQRLARRPQTAKRVFHSLSLVSALYWGTLTATTLVLAPAAPVSWAMLSMTATMCAAGNTMLGFNPVLRYPYPLMLMLPVVVVQALQPTRENLLMLGLELVFMGFLVRSSALVKADYWNGRQAQRLAELQARELELASLTDGLTQIPNRIHFDRQVKYEWSRQCRHGGHLSLLVVDLDHFKNINDSFGHPFGDTCLKRVAQALQGAFGRSTDFAARYGGEEFVVLLPDTDEAGAQAVAKHLLDAVRALSLDAEGMEVRVTCSIGLASTRPRHDQSPHALIRRADVALYDAKRGGRNRVEVAPADLTAG